MAPSRSFMPAFLLAAVLLTSLPALSQINSLGVIQGPVEADVLSVTDGDTLKIVAYGWPDEAVWRDLRIRGVDTPERYGKCTYERELAAVAKRFTEEFVFQNSGRVRLSLIGCNARYGAGFGRCLAYLHVNGVSLTDALIGAGLARRNDGEPRSSWCPQ